MSKDLIISILEFGEKNLGKAIRIEEIFSVAYDVGYLSKAEFNGLNSGDLSIGENRVKHTVLYQIFEENFEAIYTDKYIGRRFKTESYFKVVEFKELSEARMASKQSMTYSILALILAVSTIIISSCFSLYQINQPIEINNSQIKQLENNLLPIVNDINSLDESILSIRLKFDSIKVESKQYNRNK